MRSYINNMEFNIIKKNTLWTVFDKFLVDCLSLLKQGLIFLLCLLNIM